MEEYEFGRFVTSKAGHDKHNIFVIMKEESEYVYLVDGEYRTLEHPKKKKKKHIQIMNHKDDILAAKYHNNKIIRNEDIKRAIKLFALAERKIQEV